MNKLIGSTRDIEFNLDKWTKTKGRNILFITGLSGSGKTTLSEEYAKKYKATLFEIDCVQYKDEISKYPELLKVLNKHKLYKYHLNTNFYNLIMDDDYEENYNKIFGPLIMEIINYFYSKNPNELYIIEGVQIFEYIEPQVLTSAPLIVKGSSTTKSLLQRLKRNGNGKIEWCSELKNDFFELVKMYLTHTKRLNRFRRGIRYNNKIENRFNKDMAKGRVKLNKFEKDIVKGKITKYMQQL